MNETGSYRLRRYTQLAVYLCVIVFTQTLAHASTNDDLFSLSLDELLNIVVVQRQPYRGDLPLEALPQASSIIEGRLLNTVGITSFQDALDFSSAVARQNDFGGLWDSFAIRGFAGDENLPGGYFVNGFSAGRGFSGRRDTSNIDRIEVIKGAGAALYGRSEPGGTINVVTKKPAFSDKYLVRLSTGEQAQIRAEADLNKTINQSVAVRINGAYEKKGDFRNVIAPTFYALNPSLVYRLSEQAHITYEQELLKQSIPFDRGIVVLDNNFSTVPSNRFLGEPTEAANTIRATGHQLTYQNSLNGHWSLLTGFGYRKSSLEGYSSDAELFPSKQLLFSDGETLNRGRRYRNYNALDISGRIELSGNVITGNFVHHLLFGSDIYDYQLTQIQKRWAIQANSEDTTYSINIYDPHYGQSRPEVSPFWDIEEKHDSFGIYAQDQIEFSDRWSALLGFRFNNQKNVFNDLFNLSKIEQNHKKNSPHLGAIFKATQNYSFFVSYASSFRPNSGTNASGHPFAPERSRSFDSGIKFISDNDNIMGTITHFVAKKSNVLTADPNNSGFSLALGDAESRGIDLDLEVNIGENTAMNLAYAYIDAQTSKQFQHEALSSNKLINIPMHKANIVLTTRFSLRKAVILFGSSFTYVSERLGETGNSNFMLPSYTNWRLFSKVTLTEHLSLGLHVNNLLNKQYQLNSYSSLWTRPAAPRAAQLSINYNFR